MALTREANGYRYRDENFKVIHVTSVPMTDKEAVEYCSLVATWMNFKGAMYVEARRPDELVHRMLPFRYDTETKEVTRLEQAG